jgi:hypothetical protein
VQTRDDGTHVILPVAGCLTASPDHAGLPVMLPRESDGEMRRDGSRAACEQPKHPVAERGRVHGAPELSSCQVLSVAAKRKVDLSSERRQRRWRTQHQRPDRSRGQDKRPRGAARLGDGRGIVSAHVSSGTPRCVRATATSRTRQFSNAFNEHRTSRSARHEQ